MKPLIAGLCHVVFFLFTRLSIIFFVEFSLNLWKTKDSTFAILPSKKESFMSETWADRSLRLCVLDLDLKLFYIISSIYCHNLGRSKETKKGELEEKKCQDECQVPLFTLLLLILVLTSSFKNLVLVRWLNVCGTNNGKGK